MGAVQIASAEGKSVDIGDWVKLHYEEQGSGQPLVLIPGWTMTTLFFEHQMDHFAKRFRTIAFDPRSHGKSTKTDKGNDYGQHGRDL